MSEFVQKLGEYIRQMRKQKGISQEMLGERTGLHTNYIGQVERGEKNVTIESLVKIATGLELSLEQMFRHVDPMPTSDDMQKLISLLEKRSPQDRRFALQLIQTVMEWEEQKNVR